jgi:hypothetical protein
MFVYLFDIMGQIGDLCVLTMFTLLKMADSVRYNICICNILTRMTA